MTKMCLGIENRVQAASRAAHGGTEYSSLADFSRYQCDCSETQGIAWPCGDWLPKRTSNRYNRLGALAYQQLVSDRPLVRDTLRYDRSGNQIERRSGFGTGSSVTTFSYPAQSNRVTTKRAEPGLQSEVRSKVRLDQQAVLFDRLRVGRSELGPG